jgi:DNA-binding MarR family transcriptional regulator
MLTTSGASDASRRIASLTDDERKILQKIKAENNMLTGLNRLTHPENAAVNVLLAKGLVEVIPGSFPHKEDSVRIVDEDVLQLLQ